MKSEAFRGKIIDFFIFLTLSSLAALAFGFVKAVMYKDEQFSGELTVTTMPLSSEFSHLIEEGDLLYDAITKRKVGTVKKIELIDSKEDSICFKLTLDALRIPRGKALRSPEIYLEISEVNHS